MRQVGKFVVFVVYHTRGEAIGKPADLRKRDPLDNLLDDFFPLAPYDHIDVRTAVEEVLNLFRRLAAADNRGDFPGQLADEVAYALESAVPLDPDAQQIHLPSDEPVQRSRILEPLGVTEVQKRDLVDEPLDARGDILQPGGREHTHRGGGAAEAGIQHQCMLVSCHW